MSWNLYFNPLFRSFLITGGIAWLFVVLGSKGAERQDSRHIHSRSVTRWGGVAIILGFLGSLLADQNLIISHELWGVIGASAAILFFGLWDDFRELDWKLQLALQILIGSFLFYWGVRIIQISSPMGGSISINNIFLGFFILLGWMVLSINSINWLDGTDGASAGVSFLGAITIFLLTLKPEVNQPPVGIIAMALAGATLGFLIFNFHPARIIAGTSGSMFLGFILGVLAIFGGAKIATALMVMTIPVVDFFWVIGERIKNKVSIFHPDQRHLHYKLMKLGWSQTRIAIFFYFLTSLIAVLSLNTRLLGKLLSIVMVVIFMTVVMIVINNKLKLKKVE